MVSVIYRSGLFLFFNIWAFLPDAHSQDSTPPIAVEAKSTESLPSQKPREAMKQKQEKLEEKRKTPLVEDPKTDVEGKPTPTSPAQPVGLGFKTVSIAGVYSTNLTGAYDAVKKGEFYPLSGLFEIGATENISFETGLIFVERQYQVANDNYLLQQDVNRLHIPVMVKLWWRDIIAISFGPYMAFAMSGTRSTEVIRVVDSDDLETPAEDFVEFGFDSALTLNIPLKNKTGIFVEVRYFAPYDTIQFRKYNSIYGLAGFKYQF